MRRLEDLDQDLYPFRKNPYFTLGSTAHARPQGFTPSLLSRQGICLRQVSIYLGVLEIQEPTKVLDNFADRCLESSERSSDLHWGLPQEHFPLNSQRLLILRKTLVVVVGGGSMFIYIQLIRWAWKPVHCLSHLVRFTGSRLFPEEM